MTGTQKGAEAEWDKKRYSVVLEGTMEKFTQNERLLALLQGTGKELLAEASPFDRVWYRLYGGNCPCQRQALGSESAGTTLVEFRDSTL